VLPTDGRRDVAYWSEDGFGRLQLLGCAIQEFTENRWGRTIDSGWADWDVEVHCHPWTVVQIATAEEDHGGAKRLVRVRFALRASGYLRALSIAAVTCGLLGVAVSSPIAGGLGLGFLAAGAAVWWCGTRRAALAVDVVDRWARDLGMTRLGPLGDE
jgi:hypothetical protein